MLSSAAPEPGDPLEQSAQAPPADDAIAAWFLSDVERVNRATDLRAFSAGNAVTPLVDGASYFRRLCTELAATVAGDQVYFLEFRGDLDERLDGKGTEVGEVLASAAARGVAVFGLLWRSQPNAFDQSEEQNAAFVRHIDEHGGQVLLDARTRRAGSHHQKLVVIRHPGRSDQDVAFVGGIDLGRSRNDDHDHRGDPQVMDFPSSYGPRPPWHDIQAEVRGPAVARPRAHVPGALVRQQPAGHPQSVPSALRPRLPHGRHDRHARFPTRSPQTTRPAVRMPSRCCAPTLRGCGGTRSRRWENEASRAAYRKAFARARRLVYIEDQYLWSRRVADDHRRCDDAEPRAAGRGRGAPRFPTTTAPRRRHQHCWRGRRRSRSSPRRSGHRFAVWTWRTTRALPVYVHAKVVDRRRRVGHGRVGQPQPAILDPRQRAVDRGARRRARRAGAG